jgi:hypothetical protein
MSKRRRLDAALGGLNLEVTAFGVKIRRLFDELPPEVDVELNDRRSDNLRDLIVVGYSDEDKAWVAYPRSTFGVSGIGDTPSLAIEQMLIALWGIVTFEQGG